jgi:hypothetical protein
MESTLVDIADSKSVKIVRKQNIYTIKELSRKEHGLLTYTLQIDEGRIG